MGEKINGRTPEEIKDGMQRCMKNRRCHLGGKRCSYYPECLSGYPGGKMFRDAFAYIEHLESERDAALEKVPKWISVEDRLPEKPGPYLCWLCFCELPIAMTIRYLGDGKWTMPESTISHWTDNPEPPEEEG